MSLNFGNYGISAVSNTNNPYISAEVNVPKAPVAYAIPQNQFDRFIPQQTQSTPRVNALTKTIAALGVTAATLALGRKFIPAFKNFQVPEEGAKIWQKIVGKLGQAGDFINGKCSSIVNCIKGKLAKS